MRSRKAAGGQMTPQQFDHGQSLTKLLQLPLNRLSARLWHEFCPRPSGAATANTSTNSKIFIAPEILQLQLYNVIRFSATGHSI